MHRIIAILAKYIASQPTRLGATAEAKAAIESFGLQFPTNFAFRFLICLLFPVFMFFGCFWLFFLSPPVVAKALGPIVLIIGAFSAHSWLSGILFAVGEDRSDKQ